MTYVLSVLSRALRSPHSPLCFSRGALSTLTGHIGRTVPSLGDPPTPQRMRRQYEEYKQRKRSLRHLIHEGHVNPKSIFANTEINLSHVQVYGFDYDYTLIQYNSALEQVIYDLSRDILVNKLNYPKNIKHLNFNPSFAVRGLHYDILKGLIMKVDAFHNIQLGTVFRGLTPVPDDEVISLYKGLHIDKHYLTNRSSVGPPDNKIQTMIQLIDNFAMPEMNLLANVIEYFKDHEIEYDPEYLYNDVSMAVTSLHKSGFLHAEIINNIEKYVTKDLEIPNMLKRLKYHGKKIFLISNSGIDFISKGMEYIIGPDWRDIFDVVIAGARKPSFFSEESKPFRKYNSKSHTQLWEKVTSFEDGAIYQEGNLKDFQLFTKWKASEVLYFGDHVYSDLADVSSNHGWKTGAIIPELKSEINTLNSVEFRSTIRALSDLERLIDANQHVECSESEEILQTWLAERVRLRFAAKKAFNSQFGSIFRTWHNHSYFSQRLARYADLYTASVTHLLRYPLKHTFYPRRTPLPHEPF